MTAIPFGAFLVTDAKAWGALVGSRPDPGQKKKLIADDMILLWPYWYRVVGSNTRLQLIGKSAMRWEEVGGRDEGDGATDTQVIDDLAALLDDELDKQVWEVYSTTIPMCKAYLPKMQTLQRVGGSDNEWGMPQEGDYIGLLGHLYSVGHVSKLKWVGELRAQTVDPSEFVKDLTRLTGKIAIDIDSLQHARTEEDFDEMLRRMPAQERQRFLRECERMFGPSLARQTHD